MLVRFATAVATCLLLCSCGGLGETGDDCVTPQDCAEGLQCFEGKCTDQVLSCADGTVDQNGVCRFTPRSCGSGTVETDAGVCVPEEEP